jgi:hypothetical protein
LYTSILLLHPTAWHNKFCTPVFCYCILQHGTSFVHQYSVIASYSMAQQVLYTSILLLHPTAWHNKFYTPVFCYCILQHGTTSFVHQYSVIASYSIAQQVLYTSILLLHPTAWHNKRKSMKKLYPHEYKFPKYKTLRVMPDIYE